MPSADDALAAAAIAAWCAERGDRAALSPQESLAVADDEAVAALTDAAVPAVIDPALAHARDAAAAHHPAHTTGGPHPAAALLPRDVAAAHDHLEALIAGAVGRVHDGGLVLVAARGHFAHAAVASDPPHTVGVDAQRLARAVGHTGLAVVDQLAPGAASRVAGEPGALDLRADRTPGLLDAAPVTLCVGRRWRAAGERERAFFQSLPRKVVAAAVLCRDARGRVLCVHDRFKQRWTLPGGVVDADENPDDAARREAREEAGADVDLGALLGVFGSPWPDRLTFVYAATPRGEPVGPAHAHEIAAVAWLDVDDALDRLVAYVAEQVRRCLEQPGGTWRQSTV